MSLKIRVHLLANQILKIQLIAILILTLLNLLGVFSRFFLKKTFRGAVWLFALEGDSTIPTWYSSISLLACSVLILMIGLIHRRDRNKFTNQWIILSVIFLLLSIDEVATIHEWSANLINLPPSGGFLYYNWVALGAIFVMLVGLAYLRFIINLPSHVRRLFLLSAALFVGGALGVEMINATIDYLLTSETIAYAILTTFEEFCEMFGIAIFLYALVIYLRKLLGSDLIQIDCRSVHHP